MSDRVGAVITGSDFQGLGVLRCLARRGVPTILLDSDQAIGRFSRYNRAFYRRPPATDEEAYVVFLLELARREHINGWVIFPNSDAEVYVLSRHREKLAEHYRIPTPPWEVIQKVYVKENTYRIAENNSISVPRTYYPRGTADLRALDLRYPVVIKPSIRDHFYDKVKIKAIRVNSPQELLEQYSWVCSIIDPSEVLVQEFMDGGAAHLFSFCPFFKNGTTVASITARRARQHPMDFGHATTYAELVDVPEIRAMAEKYLRLIDYYGIAEVEFMQNPRTGEFKLLEVNPRVWGWHTLAIAAGIPLPYLLYQDMIGERVEPQPPVGEMKWIRTLTDLPTVVREIAGGRMKIREYLNTMKGKKTEAVFDLRDPLPFIAEIAMLPYLWKKRGY